MIQGDKIKFSGCMNGFTCSYCSLVECRRKGNYDIEGFRHEIFNRYEEYDNYVRTETSIKVASHMVISVTQEEPEFYGPMPIL